MIQTPATLELRSVFFGYPSPGNSTKTDVIKGVDLSVLAGEGVAIVGPSGCGKSTLLKLMATLLIPERGSVFYGEKEISSLDDPQRCLFRNQVLGFVFQDHRLLAQCSALENILLPTLPNPNRATEEQEISRALHLLDRVGLGDRRNHRPAELSMGQRQRVAVARSLMNEPTLLLADEPTGALDHRSSDSLLELLGDLRHEMKLSTVLVTHATSTAEAMDRVVELRDGRLQDK